MAGFGKPSEQRPVGGKIEDIRWIYQRRDEDDRRPAAAEVAKTGTAMFRGGRGRLRQGWPIGFLVKPQSDQSLAQRGRVACRFAAQHFQEGW